MNKGELLAKINQGWDDFQAYLASLSPADFTANTDAAGWTVKDHVMHLVVWEDGIRALLEGQSRHKHMGLDDATWETGDFDAVNAVIQQQHHDKPLDEVLTEFRDAHTGLLAKLETLSDADLQRPYNHYQPDPKRDKPIIDWIIGDTYEHYAAHQPWIATIVRGS